MYNVLIPVSMLGKYKIVHMGLMCNMLRTPALSYHLINQPSCVARTCFRELHFSYLPSTRLSTLITFKMFYLDCKLIKTQFNTGNS